VLPVTTTVSPAIKTTVEAAVGSPLSPTY
jgi:hypothetical protein